MYRVIRSFCDLQDVETNTKAGPIFHEYEAGDIYPRSGVEVSPERVAELAGSDNRQGCPLIEAIDAAEPDETAAESGPDSLEQLTRAELLKMAKDNGIVIEKRSTKADIIEKLSTVE